MSPAVSSLASPSTTTKAEATSDESQAGSSSMGRLLPPAAVAGMKSWKTELFRKQVRVPFLRVRASDMSRFLKDYKPWMLKVPNFKDNVSDDGGPGAPSKRVLLDPDRIVSFQDFPEPCRRRLLTEMSVSPEADFGSVNVELDHRNYRPQDMLRAVLGDDPAVQENVSGFSRIGHIIHLNLRHQVEPYKEVIGQILLQLPNVRTVVNKVNAIDNTYRNFAMEVLAGAGDDFQVQVKEHGVRFEFDFSKVYWNPRLSTEHDRVVRSLLGPDDTLYDVFAGIGPFAVPFALRWKKAAVKGKETSRNIKVFANDLNPDSFRWLKHNAALNKVEDDVKCFNLDGAEFIETVVKEGMAAWFREGHHRGDPAKVGRPHVVMNLPALATTFLPHFLGLLKEFGDLSGGTALEKPDCWPLAQVYAFSSADDQEADLKETCSEQLGRMVPKESLSVAFVRNVAPKKDMFRITVPLAPEVLFHSQPQPGPPAKRPKPD